MNRSASPFRALAVVSAVACGLILIGELSSVARLTDAAILISFILVNASLVRLGVAGRTRMTGARRTLDVVVPALGALLCGALLRYSGWFWIGMAVAVGIAGVLLNPATRAPLAGR